MVFLILICKGTVNFNHTFGCQKCMTGGIYSIERKRMSFPHINDVKRTDDNFRNKMQSQHHKKRTLLEDLPIDMIKSFPTCDPLHLLDLGLMKRFLYSFNFTENTHVTVFFLLALSRLLRSWTGGAKGYSGKWTKVQIEQINKQLIALNKYKPIEIHRSIRALSVLSFWKGTELRSFLLYYGIVVLKDYLPTEEFHHFLLLTCAVRIFYIDAYKSYRHIAKNWIDRYIEGYINIFGIDSVTSNVHNLNHIFDDVNNLGCLNETSTYPFENRLQFIKKRVKQPNRALAQVARRIVELTLDYDVLFGSKSQMSITQESQLKYPQKLGSQLIYNEILVAPDFILSCRKQSNCYFLSKTDEIVRMKYACLLNNQINICGESIINKNNLFTHPVSSSRLHIYKSDGEMNGESFYKLDCIKAKMLCFTIKREHIFMPLLHTMN